MLAVPLAGVTRRRLETAVMPVTGAHVNVTLSANPPAGCYVSMNCVERPAITVAVEGDAPRETIRVGNVDGYCCRRAAAKFPISFIGRHKRMRPYG